MKFKSFPCAAVVDGEPSVDFFAGVALVEGLFVADDYIHAGAVVAL